MKKFLFVFIALAMIFSLLSCENTNNLSNGNNDNPPANKPEDDIPPAFKAPDLPDLPANVGENIFAGKKYIDVDVFRSFTESEIISGYIYNDEEIIDEIYNYAYDTEKNCIYMTLKKTNYYDDKLYTWDEIIAEIKKENTIEFFGLRYQKSDLEYLQELCDYAEIPFKPTDTKEVLIDKLVKNEIKDMRTHYYLPEDTSDEDVLEYVAEKEAEYIKEDFEVFKIFSYEMKDTSLTFSSFLDDDFKLEDLTDYSILGNFRDTNSNTDFDIDFYTEDDFYFHFNEKDYIFDIIEITENKIRSKLNDGFGDPEAPETIELDYTTTGKGNDIIITITYEGNSLDFIYKPYIQVFILDD